MPNDPKTAPALPLPPANISRWLAPAAALAAGFLAGYLLRGGLQSSQSADTEHRQAAGYKFINPLLECEQGEGRIDVLMPHFKKGLEAFAVEEAKRNGVGFNAIYFRDLSNGPWFGIRESEKFRPASLLKVPVAMAVYKAAEERPELLRRKLRYAERLSLPQGRIQFIRPVKEIELGREYTVEELVEHMLVYSDNQALLLLSEVLPAKGITALYEALGVDRDVVENMDGKLSLRAFGTFYRILFNASYLSRANSEKLLEMLSRSVYTRGLVAGVPPAVPVAHKFGEGGELGRDLQLQDCGIVYHPSRPYLICVVGSGPSHEGLEKFISSVSAFVFEQVSSVGK